MKSLFAIILMCASIAGFASQESIVKTCSTELSMPDMQPVSTKIEIAKNADGEFSAITTQTVDGFSMPRTENAQVFLDQEVRQNVLSASDNSDLNLAEKLISHAMLLENDPVFEGSFSTGLDLTKIRSASVFLVGEISNMGGIAIVESKDENGKNIGSFLGGFLISPCQ